MIYYRISQLMLATLIQIYDKNHFISRTRELLQVVSGAKFYDCINTFINLLNLSWIIKYLFFEECGAFKPFLFVRNLTRNEPISIFH